MLSCVLCFSCAHACIYPPQPPPVNDDKVSLSTPEAPGAFIQSAFPCERPQDLDDKVDILWRENSKGSEVSFRNRRRQQYVVVRRVKQRVTGVALKMSDDGAAGYPAAILRETAALDGQSAEDVTAAINAFYGQLEDTPSQRGAVTGLILFDNHNDMSIELAADYYDPGILRFRTTFKKFGTFDAAASPIRLAPCGVLGVKTKVEGKIADRWGKHWILQ